MNILLAVAGPLESVPIAGFCRDALRALGHTVTTFDYRPSLQDKLLGRLQREQDGTARRLRKTLVESHAQVFFTLSGFGLPRAWLEELGNHGLKRICWHIGNPLYFERVLKKVDVYDHVFCTSKQSADKCQTTGMHHVHFLPPACDPAVHRLVEPMPRYESEVCFIGNWSAQREKILGALAQRFRVRILGCWKEHIDKDSRLHKHLIEGAPRPLNVARACASSKIVLNIHSWFNRFDHGVNHRLFEIAGCGAFQMVDVKQEIPALFDCKSEVRCYKTIGEITPLIEEALISEAARKTFGEAAQSRAHAQHTYYQRMQVLTERAGIA